MNFFKFSFLIAVVLAVTGSVAAGDKNGKPPGDKNKGK